MFLWAVLSCASSGEEGSVNRSKCVCFSNSEYLRMMYKYNFVSVMFSAVFWRVINHMSVWGKVLIRVLTCNSYPSYILKKNFWRKKNISTCFSIWFFSIFPQISMSVSYREYALMVSAWIPWAATDVPAKWDLCQILPSQDASVSNTANQSTKLDT